MSTKITIRFADFSSREDTHAIVDLVDMLASWPSDEGGKISSDVRQTMIPRLREVPGAFALLALHEDRPVGLAVCFEGFSTFHASPLINIHDFVVRPEARRQGVGQMLLERIEQEAKDRDCCRITLEVYETNAPARKLYESFGFGSNKAGTPTQHFMTKQF